MELRNLESAHAQFGNCHFFPQIAKSNVKVYDPLIVAHIDIVQFADEKTSLKILQQARQQQEELQEEFGLTRYLW